MNCDKAIPWLLSARSEEALPGDLSAHLSACASCRSLRALLDGIEAMARASATSPSPATLARLAAALDSATRPRSVSPRLRGSRLRNVATLATAAAIFCAIGWLAGRSGGIVRIDPVPPPAPDRTARIRPDPLIVRVAAQSSKLTYSPGKTERIEALMSMADEVRAEAMRRAASGAADDIPPLARVHNTLMRHGVAGCILAITPRERKPFAERFARELRSDEAGLFAAESRMPDAVAVFIRPLRESIRAAVADIESDRLLKPAKEESDPTRLETLIALSVRLAETDIPLQRAELSADMANVLAFATVLVALEADDQAVDKLSGYMDAVLVRGVGENLTRVEADDPDEKLKGSIRSVREKSGQSIAVLERNAGQAPPQARKGLERAAQASRVGLDREDQKRAGPPAHGGPPWKRPEGGRIPPGQQKKP